MPHIVIKDSYLGTVTIKTKTVSEAWEVARVLMANNPSVKSAEVNRGE